MKKEGTAIKKSETILEPTDNEYTAKAAHSEKEVC